MRRTHCHLITHTDCNFIELLARKLNIKELTIAELHGECGYGTGREEMLNAPEAICHRIIFSRKNHFKFMRTNIAYLARRVG